jgi:putative hydrolase of the HAD superfamily
VTTHVLFDFFGTLVRYSESRVEQGYGGSHRILAQSGSRLAYTDFLDEWVHTCEEFDRRAEASLDEYSMTDVCAEFLRRALPATPHPEVVAAFRDAYLDEWNKGVGYIAGVNALLADLACRHTLVLVTNTHHAALVHGHLEAMGVGQHFHSVVTSVEHGKRKPSPAIFLDALARSHGRAAEAVYVGDSYAADYQGAAGAGLRCLLLDPRRVHDVPAADRLVDILELRRVLR